MQVTDSTPLTFPSRDGEHEDNFGPFVIPSRDGDHKGRIATLGLVRMIIHTKAEGTGDSHHCQFVFLLPLALPWSSDEEGYSMGYHST